MEELRAPKGATRNRKVLGRGPGSGKGKTSGKGHNGQNARSGGGVRPGFEGGQMPLYRRVARRGFSNYPFKVEYEVLNVGRLEKAFDSGDTVNIEVLRQRRLVSRNAVRVKLLGQGDLTKKLHVSDVNVSKSAAEKIAAVGGTVAQAVDSEQTNQVEANGIESDS